MGSYRRGKVSSGDIDIIITSPSHHTERLSLAPLIRYLMQQGLIKHILSLSVDLKKVNLDKDESPQADLTSNDLFVSATNPKDLESETFMGICLLPENFPNASGVYRRIDIKSYPSDAFAFALLYFTGSAHFNRSMRYYAKNIGFSLSDKGMYPCTRFSRDRVLKGDSIVCRTEEEIFDALGLEYRAPVDRNCDEITVVSKEGTTATTERIAPELIVEEEDEEPESLLEEPEDESEAESREGDSEDEEEINKLPTNYLHNQETVQEFIHRCSPSSFRIRTHWIRIWKAGFENFDELDEKRNLIRIEIRKKDFERRKVKLDIGLAIQICSEENCLSGKWRIFVKREHVEAVWEQICYGVLNGSLGIGAKVNSISHRQRKHFHSIISVYTEDFRNNNDIKRVLQGIREVCKIKGTVSYRSEAISLLLPEKTSLYVSRQGTVIIPDVLCPQ